MASSVAKTPINTSVYIRLTEESYLFAAYLLDQYGTRRGKAQDFISQVRGGATVRERVKKLTKATSTAEYDVDPVTGKMYYEVGGKRVLEREIDKADGIEYHDPRQHMVDTSLAVAETPDCAESYQYVFARLVYFLFPYPKLSLSTLPPGIVEGTAGAAGRHCAPVGRAGARVYGTPRPCSTHSSGCCTVVDRTTSPRRNCSC